MKRTTPLLLALLSCACAAEVEPVGETSAAIRRGPTRGPDPVAVLTALTSVASQDAGRFSALVDSFRARPTEYALALEEARRLHTAPGSSERRLVLHVIGLLAEPVSLDGLERELASCTARPYASPFGRPRQLTCTPVNGDLPVSCGVPGHPDMFDDVGDVESAQMHALDAFDRIGFAHRSSEISRRFRTALDRIIDDPRCGRPIRDAAAMYLIERSPDPAAARADLLRRHPTDAQFGRLARRTPYALAEAPRRTAGGRR